MSANTRSQGITCYALAGVSVGLTLAVALEQWTWLDMRFNTGLLVPLTVLAGGVAGYIRKRGDSWIGPLCLAVLVATLLVVTGGNLFFMWIIMGAAFRQGIGLPDLSLALADLLVLLLLLASLITSIFAGRGNSLHQK